MATAGPRWLTTGQLPFGVTAKDLVLYVIGVIGTAGGTGHVIEYCGDVIRQLSMVRAARRERGGGQPMGRGGGVGRPGCEEAAGALRPHHQCINLVGGLPPCRP